MSSISEAFQADIENRRAVLLNMDPNRFPSFPYNISLPRGISGSRTRPPLRPLHIEETPDYLVSRSYFLSPIDAEDLHDITDHSMRVLGNAEPVIQCSPRVENGEQDSPETPHAALITPLGNFDQFSPMLGDDEEEDRHLGEGHDDGLRGQAEIFRRMTLTSRKARLSIL